MRIISRRTFVVLLSVIALETFPLGIAYAHTGEDASASHVFKEFGLWGLGVAFALCVLGVVFWIRAKRTPEGVE